MIPPYRTQNHHISYDNLNLVLLQLREPAGKELTMNMSPCNRSPATPAH